MTPQPACVADSAHGARTCCGNAGSGGDTPHWQQDADLFASWGVDYLKLDSCGGYEKNYTADPVGRQCDPASALCFHCPFPLALLGFSLSFHCLLGTQTTRQCGMR